MLDESRPESEFRPEVMFVTRKWSPAVGGMETYCLELTSELASRCSLQVVALAAQDESTLPSFLAMLAFSARAVRRYLARERPPEVLHVGDMAAWPLALLAFARKPRPLLVISAHGTDVSYHRRGGFRGTAYSAYLRLGARLLGGGARVIANSAATARAAGETGWKTYAIVPLATRSEQIATGSTAVGRRSSELLFAGRLIAQKGCGWFVKYILPELPEEISLRVAGPILDEGERAALDDPRVEYLGVLDSARLHAAYRKALAVVVPNIERPSGEFEGFGLVAPEAAAAGGVVLAARTGGLVEAVLDGETGFLVPPGDAPAWRARILEVAGWSQDHRTAFTAHAAARARAYYAWSRVADEVMAVYEAGEATIGFPRELS